MADSNTGLESFPMRAMFALASLVDGSSETDVEVLTELSKGYYLVRFGWSHKTVIVHRSRLVPRNDEAMKCLEVDDFLLEPIDSQRAYD